MFGFHFRSCPVFSTDWEDFLWLSEGEGVSARTGRIVHVRCFSSMRGNDSLPPKKNKQTNTNRPGHLLKGVAYWKNNSFQMISYQFQLRSVFVAFDDGCILWPARAINYDDAIIIVKKTPQTQANEPFHFLVEPIFNGFGCHFRWDIRWLKHQPSGRLKPILRQT